MARPVITLRIHAGFNAGSFLAGLLALTASPLLPPAELLKARFPNLENVSLALSPASVNDIAGWSLNLQAPHEHVHRHVADIASIYAARALSEAARDLAMNVWHVIANAEAAVHGGSLESVHFHEVGRIANIVSIGLAAELLCAIQPERLIASPIPLGDGTVLCAHGAVPNPAPSTFAMLDGVPVRPFLGEGEAITPTGLGALLGFGAAFGPWPEMTVRKHATVFVPGKIFEGVPNGTLFAMGEPL
jgi:uncharacterized protein (DUF111 family)